MWPPSDVIKALSDYKMAVVLLIFHLRILLKAVLINQDIKASVSPPASRIENSQFSLNINN